MELGERQVRVSCSHTRHEIYSKLKVNSLQRTAVDLENAFCSPWIGLKCLGE